MRHAGHEPAPGGSLTSRGSRSPWGHADGPGRMAPRPGPRRARQSHAGAAASPSARIEPGREHLAVLARQLVVEPRVRLLRRHRRPLLLRVEPPHRPALAHHVHRPPELGQCMMISAGWYKLSWLFARCPLIRPSDRCLAALSRHLQEAAETRRGSVHLDSNHSTPSWLARNKVSWSGTTCSAGYEWTSEKLAPMPSSPPLACTTSNAASPCRSASQESS